MATLLTSLMKNTHPINKHHIHPLQHTKESATNKVLLADTDTTKTIIQALVLSKLNYCHSLAFRLIRTSTGQTSENTKHGLLNNFQSQEIKSHQCTWNHYTGSKSGKE